MATSTRIQEALTLAAFRAWLDRQPTWYAVDAPLVLFIADTVGITCTVNATSAQIVGGGSVPLPMWAVNLQQRLGLLDYVPTCGDLRQITDYLMQEEVYSVLALHEGTVQYG